MAKDKKSKKAEKADKADRARKTSKSDKKSNKSRKAKSGLAEVASKTGKVVTSYAVEEIVAATLVAAAAAISDPKKARAIASAAGSELKALTGEAAKEGSALWRLALDIARKSLDFVGAGGEAASKPEASAPTARTPRRRGGS